MKIGLEVKGWEPLKTEPRKRAKEDAQSQVEENPLDHVMTEWVGSNPSLFMTHSVMTDWVSLAPLQIGSETLRWVARLSAQSPRVSPLPFV